MLVNYVRDLSSYDTLILFNKMHVLRGLCYSEKGFWRLSMRTIEGDNVLRCGFSFIALSQTVWKSENSTIKIQAGIISNVGDFECIISGHIVELIIITLYFGYVSHYRLIIMKVILPNVKSNTG